MAANLSAAGCKRFAGAHTPALVPRLTFLASARFNAPAAPFLGRKSARRQAPVCAAVAAVGAKPCCKAATAAAAAAAAAAPAEAVLYTVICSVTYTALCFVAMLLAPRKSATAFSSVLPFLPLALAYLVLLVSAWSPDTLSTMMPGSLAEGLTGGFNPQFFPKLEGIATLFSRVGVSASWLVHILCINLFAGRWCLIEGLRSSIPTFHSVALCAVLGPLGVISHYITRALVAAVPALRTQEAPIVLRSDQGNIIIMPYTEP